MPGRRPLWVSIGYAVRGLAVALYRERSVRLHAVAACGAVALAAWCGLEARDWLFVLLAIALVLAAEMVNTAIEKTLDLHGTGWSPLAGMAKDVAAGAVLVCALYALAVAYLVLWPAFLAKIGVRP
ncbi:MAG: diacylglycerol kinase family protein [Firmicutes bacterium]|nr:diacylglycerol kinase family protein [Bacillota bacterium]